MKGPKNMMKRKASKNNLLFYNDDDDDDDDDKYGIQETAPEEGDICYEPNELVQPDDLPSSELTKVYGPKEAIKFISQKERDKYDKLLCIIDKVSPTYIESQYGTYVDNTESLKCTAKTPNNSRQLPAVIYKLFRDVEMKKICKIISETQHMLDKFWETYDNLLNGKLIDESKCEQYLYQYFQANLYRMSYGYTYRQQILQYISDHAYRMSSYGGLFINSKREILSVQNHHGTWGPPKGSPKVNDNDEWETTKETGMREILEEVKITDIKRKHEITMKNINEYFNFDRCLYLECIVDNYPQGRRIGLYVIRINNKELEFELRDKKENINCQWLNLQTILDGRPESGHDSYYTLRKFAEYLNKHRELFPN